MTPRQRQARIRLIRRHYGMTESAAAQLVRADSKRATLLARGKLSFKRLVRETKTPARAERP